MFFLRLTTLNKFILNFHSEKRPLNFKRNVMMVAELNN